MEKAIFAYSADFFYALEDMDEEFAQQFVAEFLVDHGSNVILMAGILGVVREHKRCSLYMSHEYGISWAYDAAVYAQTFIGKKLSDLYVDGHFGEPHPLGYRDDVYNCHFVGQRLVQYTSIGDV